MAERPRLYEDPLPIVSAPMAGVSDPMTRVPSTTSQQLAPENPNRAAGLLTTTSSLPVFVRFGADASPGVGGFHLIVTATTPAAVPPGITAAIHVVVAGVAAGAIAFTEWLR